MKAATSATSAIEPLFAVLMLHPKILYSLQTKDLCLDCGSECRGFEPHPPPKENKR